MKKLTVILFYFFAYTSLAQKTVRFEEALQMVKNHNKINSFVDLGKQANAMLEKSAFERPKTNFDLQYGRTQATNLNDYTLVMSQGFTHPKVLSSHAALIKTQALQFDVKLLSQHVALRYSVSNLFSEFLYLHARKQTLSSWLSTYSAIIKIIDKRYQLGESALYDKKWSQSLLQLTQFEIDKAIWQQNAIAKTLSEWAGASVIPDSSEILAAKMQIEENTEKNPEILSLETEIQNQNASINLEKAKLKPDFVLGWAHQSMNHTWPLLYLNGGLNYPIFQKGQKAKIEALKIGNEALQKQIEWKNQQIAQQVFQIKEQINFLDKEMAQIKDMLLPNQISITQLAQKQWLSNEGELLQWVQQTDLQKNYELQIVEKEWQKNLLQNQVQSLLGITK